MTPRIALAPLAAALAIAAAPARSQHAGHDAAHHAEAQARSSAALAAAGIAEGKLEKGVRTVEMAVTEAGFVPAKIKANKGELLRLVITRKTDRTCATEIVVAGHGIDRKLPLNQPVTVELTPKASGEIRYACGMNHVAGVVFVP